jgi:hypothetical protein
MVAIAAVFVEELEKKEDLGNDGGEKEKEDRYLNF